MKGKWTFQRLDQIGTIMQGGTPSTTVDEYWTGSIPFITPVDLRNVKHAIIDKTERYVSESGIKNSSANLIPEQSIVISTRAPIGYIAITEIPSVTNQGCKSIVFENGQCPLFHYYNLHMYINTMKRYGVGTTFAEISKRDLTKIVVSFPKTEREQQHIADILTSCDEVIEQTEKAIAKYRDIKSGMLQDLFTRGLDSNGKLRPKPEDAPELYKDSPLGKIPKEWEFKKIGEMFDFKNGLNKGKEFFGYGVPIVNYMDVYKHDRITPDMLHGRVCLTLQEIQNFTVCSGDVFFTRTSETPEEVGFASVIEGLCQNVVFSGFVLRARPITDDLLDCYKQYCFRINSLRKEIVADCTYTTRALTNGTKLSEYYISVPRHKEQQEIANRLNSIDAQIEEEEQALKKYHSLKLGLMKQLLTPPEGALEA